MSRNKILPYNPNLKKLARELRKNSTLSEVLVWKELKGKRMLGYEFHRQLPIDNYIVDFYCHELMLAIEIDGNSHNFKDEDVRQNRLEALGVRFIRFTDLEPKMDIKRVLECIQNWIEEKAEIETSSLEQHPPGPLQRGNRSS